MAREVPELPDLEGVADAATLDLILNNYFRSSPSDPQVRALVTNLVRLSDSATFEYRMAKARFDDWRVAPTGHFLPFFRGQSHLENCVTSTHRALNYTERLRRAEDAPKIAKHDLPAGRLREAIRKVRDDIEHFDKDLASERVLSEGASTSLRPRVDHAEIGDNSLKYSELALAIELIDSLVRKLLNHDWQIRDLNN